jgi:hypothetical protein
MLLSLSLTNYTQFLSQNPALSLSEPNTQLVRNTGGKISQAVTKYMKEIVNEGIKKVQKLMATKMQEMGGLSGLGM